MASLDGNDLAKKSCSIDSLYPPNMNRRDFIRNSALLGSSTLLLGQTIASAGEPVSEHSATPTSPAASGEPRPKSAPRELTVAGLQMLVSKDVAANERAIHRAIDQAAGVKADFLLTPEGSLSGYHPDFDRVTVVDAVERLARHAQEARVGLLLGTCYKTEEEGIVGSEPILKRHEFCYDQVRVYAPNGEYLGSHAKILLTSPIGHPGTGEMKSYVGGTLRTFTWDGICFGVLICNDLWATPGATTITNPYLAWRLKEMGAQMIFHSVNTAGTPLLYRPYHESNEELWAGALNIPIVTVNAANPDGAPTNCRASVVTPDGKRHCLAPDAGEQFFSYKLLVG